MTVQAYITAGATVIPVLLPDAVMLDTARQIGIPEGDLFSVDVPLGMTRHTCAKVLIASTQMSALYATTNVSLTLEDSSGSSIALSNLYARPPQPFFWGQQGGVVMVELVDVRWYWQFTSGAIMSETLAPLWSSDGRWQVNGTGATNPILTYSNLLSRISTAATAMNLGGTAPTNFTTRSPEYIRRLSDLVGSPNATLSLLLDAIAVANGQVIVSTGTTTRFIERNNLKTFYDTEMGNRLSAFRGGMQPVNGAAGGTDALVNLWNQNGFLARAPVDCAVVMPQRSVEGLTVYDNCTSANTPATQQQFTEKSIYTNAASISFTRLPNKAGLANITDASVVVKNNAGAVLTASPGWDAATFAASVRADYLSRYSDIPFGRTVWAGWPEYWRNAGRHIGQLGLVSYRLAVIDGEWSPYCITECREDDWRFGLQGTGISEPVEIVTGKGLAHAYRNCVGATIVDVAPPNTRVFPAKITASEQMTGWLWKYSWTEVEPNPDLTSGTPQVTIGSYARTGAYNARNMAENGNVFIGAANPGNVVAPGVLQADYLLGTISALPISNDTVVMMCEQFPTSNVAGSPPFGPQYWFSMPNAVLVECTDGPSPGGGVTTDEVRRITFIES